MIIGLGIDTVTISQVDGFLQNPNYALDIFTETEIQQASESRDAADFLSGRFAAKQALRKALEPLIHDTLDYLGVSIVKTDYSQPVAVFDGKFSPCAAPIAALLTAAYPAVAASVYRFAALTAAFVDVSDRQ